jgi:hypothetical protein
MGTLHSSELYVAAGLGTVQITVSSFICVRSLSILHQLVFQLRVMFCQPDCQPLEPSQRVDFLTRGLVGYLFPYPAKRDRGA